MDLAMTTTNEANELTAQLWRQRELLELLLFKYEEERLLSAAGKSRWSAHAAREVDVVIERLSACSLSTAVAISGLGEAWGLPRGSLLRDLAENAPSPMWQDIFSEHLEAMVGLICEIRDLRAETAPTYGATGAADHTEQSARLIDTML
jgi:hypothetical protein